MEGSCLARAIPTSEEGSAGTWCPFGTWQCHIPAVSSGGGESALHFYRDLWAARLSPGVLFQLGLRLFKELLLLFSVSLSYSKTAPDFSDSLILTRLMAIKQEAEPHY